MAKLPIFSREASRVSGFLIACRLLISIYEDEDDLVEKQVQ